MTDLIEALYRQNEWANLRLIDVCRTLSDAQLDVTAIGAFGSIRDTLTHAIRSEAGYVRRLGGEPHALWPRGTSPGFDVLADTAHASAEGLIERAHAVGGTTVVVEEDGARTQIEANVLLVQALHHGTEHRSQICSILTALEVHPTIEDTEQGLLDAWSWSDALGLARRLD